MRKYLYFTVFTSGMTTLALELSASRLIGSVFGTSNLVWAAIIGIILIYLTLGYYLGGRMADRSPNYLTMYTILAWGAFFVGLVPFLAKPVLLFAANAFDGLQIGILAGSFVVVLVLFSIPVTLLGMISPFAIRLSIKDPGKSGVASGKIYAISTLGSFLGTFLPVLLLIPLVGTTKTFLIFSHFLLIVAIIGLILSSGLKKALPYIFLIGILLVLAITIDISTLKRTTGQIFEQESGYNYIQVLERDGYFYLRLNEGQGVHSIYKSGEYDFGGPWQQFLVAPFFNENTNPRDVKRIAIIGLAAGTVARQAAKVFPEVIIDGYELDPQIISVGMEYFGMNLPNLNIFIEDGRIGLKRSPYQYELIGVDAYRPPYIPWHMTSIEFFQIVFDHLSDEGALAINVGRAPGDRRLIEGLYSTISQIFPSVYIMDIPGTFNSIIYATRNPTTKEGLNENMVLFSTDSAIDQLLTTSMYYAWINLQPNPASRIVYTDDKAPIEWITNDMVLKYILFGQKDPFQ
ncbi:spermidine synthase [Chloroflexota bacterium]